ncbi:hypothetical protein DPMN_027660 [Dreissena polymorpha]|uniref:Uncharacterized protein n=1 Tax=Dreissena polymorpha TaxID=45954 RepID=A0A9D4LT97_DREPO|nr:hypothetical protein DPMN_027660 [Dreissena polymorpha]
MFLYSKIKKTAPPGSHVIQLTGTIFELNSHIKETNVLSKFHANWANNVTSRREKNAPPTGGHVFSPIWTIFEVVRDINKTNVLTNFHDDWAKIVTSRETNVLTKFHENWAKNATSRVFTCFHYIHIEKNAPPTGGHVFFTDLDYFRTLFTRKTAPPTGGHVFQRTETTFELDQHINKANILTNFKLGRDFIGAKLFAKFNEDGTRNVASRVFTSKCLRTDGHTTDKDRSEKLT